MRVGLVGGFVAAFCAPLVLSSACSGTGGNQDSDSIVVGRIQVIGNEPFTRVAIETTSGETFILKCEESLEELLRGNQGKLVRVHFRGTERDPRGTALSVLRAELLKE